jgi:hypothetical protein
MAYRYKLREEEAEATPSNREQVNYDVVVTPKGVSVEDTVKALETLDNYGMYVSNMRNKSSIQKAIEDHFGPVIPAKRKKMERDQGFPFPIKTKTSIDDFVKSHTSKPTLLKYKVKDDTIVFPKSGNPAKDLTKKIIDVVMKSAKIDYSVADKEAVDEAKKETSINTMNENFPGPGEIVDAKYLNNAMLDYFNRMNIKLLINTKTEKGIKGRVGTFYGDLVFNGGDIKLKDIVSVEIVESSMNEDKLDQEAKVYFMQQVKLGKIKELPKDPKAEYMKIKMTKKDLKEVIREQIKNLIK